MRLGRRNILDVARHPSWFFSVFAKYLLRAGVPMLENFPEELRQKLMAVPAAGTSQCLTMPRNDALTWDDLRDLRNRWSGPLLVKGILHPADAAAAVECGVDGIIVSSHGGLNLDSSLPPIQALPEIVERVMGFVGCTSPGELRTTDIVCARLTA